jgi:hypothetical protein
MYKEEIMIKIIWLFLLLFFATSVQSKMAFLPAPLSVTASSNLMGSIKITWKKNSQGGAVDYYTIYRSTTPNVTGAEERLGTVKQGLPLSFTDSNPIPAKKYYYWVVSCPQENAQSTADMSISCSNILVQKSVVGQTKYTKMAAPGNFKITNNNADGFVYLQWDVVSNAFSYKVMRDGKNYTTVTTNSFIDKNVVDKKSYLYNVKACDQFENCGASVQKSIKVIGAVVVPKIMSISANPQSIVQGQSLTLVNGMSGTEITLIGTGFSDKSQVMVGGQLAATRYVSDTELHFAIPFTSINGQLNSLPADKYNVQVNGSNSLVLQVDELPANPYPAGTVLSEQVNTMYQQLSETSAQYQKMLPDLLVEAKDDKSLQNILKLVGDIANKLNAEGLSDLNQKIGKIDQQALDLLERSIVANESKNNTPSPNKIQKLQMNAVYGVVASSKKEGDTWLLKRKGNADISNALEKIDKYTAYGCAAVTVGTSVFATPATGVMAAQLCSALASSNLIVGITTDILNTKTVGRISRLNLKISGITDKDKVFQVTSKNEHIDLNVEKNNKAKNIVSASIGVTNNLPHATLAKKTFDMGTGFKSTLTAKSAVGAMVDKLKDELRSYVTAKDVANGEKIDPAKEIDKFISPNDKKFDISLSNLEFFPCNLDNKIIVLDDGTISVTSTSEQKIEVGLCKFQVKEKSRLPLEEDVDSVISFTIVGGGYTKIANNGSSLPDSAVLGTKPTDWACTKDNKTGLIWEVKTSDGGLRDKNNEYTNYDAIYPKCDWNNCEKDYPSKLGASTNTDGFVKAVNAQGLCGSSNWRLPTKDELLTISPAGYDTGYFEEKLNNYYWSSSTHANFSSYAWRVSFGYGFSDGDPKDDNNFVRLVR